MKIKSSMLLLTGTMAVIISCSPYHRLVKDFTRNKTSIQYLYTSNKNLSKSNIQVSISKPVIADPKFKSGAVLKVKTEIIPLIVYNGWNYQYECVVGRNQIKENMNSFIQLALLEESKRSGIFLADTISNHPYSIEIEVDSLKASGPHKTSGFFVYLFFFYFRQNVVKAGDVPAYCRIHYRLRKGDQILLDDFVSNYSSLEFLKPYPFNTKTINTYFKTHLVESLGDAIKKNIEAVVKAINKKLTVEQETQ